jgi:hypothetical protein
MKKHSRAAFYGNGGRSCVGSYRGPDHVERQSSLLLRR